MRRSPCLSCSHHLSGGDKNGFRCGTCPQRQLFVTKTHDEIYTSGEYHMMLEVPVAQHAEVSP